MCACVFVYSQPAGNFHVSYVCMYVCVYVCMYVCMYVYVRVGMYVVSSQLFAMCMSCFFLCTGVCLCA